MANMEKVLLKSTNGGVIIPVVNELTNYVNGVDVTLSIDKDGKIVSKNAVSINLNVRPSVTENGSLTKVVLLSDIAEIPTNSGGLEIVNNKIQHRELYTSGKTAKVYKTAIDTFGHVRSVTSPNKMSFETEQSEYDELSDTTTTYSKLIEYDGNSDVLVVGGSGISLTSVGNVITISSTQSGGGSEGETGYRGIFAPTQATMKDENPVVQVIAPSNDSALKFSTDFIMNGNTVRIGWTNILEEEISYE